MFRSSTVHPWLSELTNAYNFHELHYNLQDGSHLALYFNHPYVTCFLHTNSIHASAKVQKGCNVFLILAFTEL